LKNAAIFHGTGGNKDSFWHPWLKNELEGRGYKVWLPSLPNPDIADLKEWLPFVLDNGEYNKETVLVGHSSGAPLILSILENIETPIKQVILVGGYCEQLSAHKSLTLQEKYDWNKIRRNCKEFIFINSDDDPWGCNDTHGRKMFDKLGGAQIILHRQGHMGSEKFNQPYKKFPLLLKLID